MRARLVSSLGWRVTVQRVTVGVCGLKTATCYASMSGSDIIIQGGGGGGVRVTR